MNTYKEGRIGEDAAAAYLKRKGYKIKERNFRCAFGEIDIISFKRGFTVFTEVKSRSSETFGLPREAVTKDKQKTIIKCAEYYLARNALTGKPVRFDVLEILGGKINLIEDAYRP